MFTSGQWPTVGVYGVRSSPGLSGAAVFPVWGSVDAHAQVQSPGLWLCQVFLPLSEELCRGTCARSALADASGTFGLFLQFLDYR